MIVPQDDFDGTHCFGGRVLVEHGVERSFNEQAPRDVVEFVADEHCRTNAVERLERRADAFVADRNVVDPAQVRIAPEGVASEAFGDRRLLAALDRLHDVAVRETPPNTERKPLSRSSWPRKSCMPVITSTLPPASPRKRPISSPATRPAPRLSIPT